MIEVIVSLFVGVLIGWFARERYAMHVIKAIIKDATEEAKESIRENIIDIIVEKHDEVIYVYEKHNGAFLAQGKNMDELTEILLKSHPGKIFNASPDHMKILKKES